MTTIEKLNAVIGSNVHQILDPLAVQAAQAAITEIETLSRVLNAACEALGKSPDCPSTDILYSECALPDSGTCTACWRRYLLARADQEDAQ